MREKKIVWKAQFNLIQCVVIMKSLSTEGISVKVYLFAQGLQIRPLKRADLSMY